MATLRGDMIIVFRHGAFDRVCIRTGAGWLDLSVAR